MPVYTTVVMQGWFFWMCYCLTFLHFTLDVFVEKCHYFTFERMELSLAVLLWGLFWQTIALWRSEAVSMVCTDLGERDKQTKGWDEQKCRKNVYFWNLLEGFCSRNGLCHVWKTNKMLKIQDYPSSAILFTTRLHVFSEPISCLFQSLYIYCLLWGSYEPWDF